MDDGCGGGKAIYIYVPKPLGAHMEVMVNEPRVPTQVSISILKDHERARVEVGHVVVDPLLFVVEGVDHHELREAATAARTCDARGVSTERL
eukprot:scaffold14890_cov140-Isochrysis_galbana.AAC.2